MQNSANEKLLKLYDEMMTELKKMFPHHKNPMELLGDLKPMLSEADYKQMVGLNNIAMTMRTNPGMITVNSTDSMSFLLGITKGIKNKMYNKTSGLINPALEMERSKNISEMQIKMSNIDADCKYVRQDKLAQEKATLHSCIATTKSANSMQQIRIAYGNFTNCLERLYKLKDNIAANHATLENTKKQYLKTMNDKMKTFDATFSVLGADFRMESKRALNNYIKSEQIAKGKEEMDSHYKNFLDIYNGLDAKRRLYIAKIEGIDKVKSLCDSVITRLGVRHPIKKSRVENLRYDMVYKIDNAISEASVRQLVQTVEDELHNY